MTSIDILRFRITIGILNRLFYSQCA